MRANLLFVLGLITISCVASTSTSFQALLSKDAEFSATVQKMKATNSMGSIILSMAELTEEQGRFAALFDAIDNLSKFLVQDRASENQSFQQATAQFHQDVSRLTKQRDVAFNKFTSDNSKLKNKLYPARLALQKKIASLESQLSKLESDLRVLRANRVQEIAVFKQRSADYVAGINACKRALPLLRALVNGQSFAELDADVFEQISSELKQSLGKLEMGPLYNVFVESMVQTLTKQNYVQQQKLQKVIGLIANLQERLEKGLVALNNDEALNLKRFVATEKALESAIANTKAQLATDRARLVKLNAYILATEKHRDQQQALYNQRVQDLALVNKNYTQRTNDHNQFIREVDSEEATIADAVRVLNKGGVTRSA